MQGEEGVKEKSADTGDKESKPADAEIENQADDKVEQGKKIKVAQDFSQIQVTDLQCRFY